MYQIILKLSVSDFSIYEDDRVKYLDYNPLEYPYTVEYYSEVTYNSTAFFPSWIPLDDYYVSIQNAEYKIVNEVGLDLKTKKENFEDYNCLEPDFPYDLDDFKWLFD